MKTGTLKCARLGSPNVHNEGPPRRRGDQNQEERRALRALQFVHMGELSSGRQALEGAELAPGNETTLRELNKRPARPMDPIPELPPSVPVFNLDEQTFSKNVRSARRGAAGGPSGMTTDHLRPLLDNTKDTHLVVHSGRVVGKRAHPGLGRTVLEVGQNDSAAQGWRGSAGHCGWRSDPQSHRQNHRPTVGTSSECSHSSAPICTLHQGRVRVYRSRPPSID